VKAAAADNASLFLFTPNITTMTHRQSQDGHRRADEDDDDGAEGAGLSECRDKVRAVAD
jgi:hypothetical protein